MSYVVEVKMVKVTLQTVSEFLAVEFTTVPVIGSDILDEGGIMEVVGATSLGKSYLLLQMALNMATGTPFLDTHKVPHCFRVALLQAEIGPKNFQRRMAKLKASFEGFGYDNLSVASVYDVKLDRMADLLELESALVDGGFQILIIDPLLPFHEGDENKSNEMQKLFDGFDRLRFRHGVAIIFSHHERKPYQGVTFKKQKGMLESRGSSLITDRPDTVIRMCETKKPQIVEVMFDKMRNADNLLDSVLLWGDRESGLFVPPSAGDTGDIITNGQMLHLLTGGPLGLDEFTALLAGMGMSNPRTVSRRIAALEFDELVVRVPNPKNKRKKIIMLKGMYDRGGYDGEPRGEVSSRNQGSQGDADHSVLPVDSSTTNSGKTWYTSSPRLPSG